MKLSEIKALLENNNFESFKKLISNEINDYKNKMKKKGSSIPIIVEEDINLDISNIEAIFFLKSFVEGHLSKYEIAYIADAILLSEKIKFESDEIIDEFESLTDLSTDTSLTIEKAKYKIIVLKS